MTRSQSLNKPVEMVVIDPVCKKKMDPWKKSFVTSHSGCIYYFCSENCRKVFEKNPERCLQSETGKNKGWWFCYLDRLNRYTCAVPSENGTEEVSA